MKLAAVLAAALVGCGAVSGAAAASGVMTFEPLGLYEQVEDTYTASLGVTWERAAAVSAAHLVTQYGETSDPPSLPNVMQIGDDAADSTYGSMNADAGFVGGVSFYYAWNQLLLGNVTAEGHHLQLAKVSAWSGEDGTGKLLGEMTLPITKGNYTYTFKKVAFPFKGVAKSVAFYPPLVEGDVVAYGVLFDNVKVVVADALAAKLADKAADAEDALAAKEEKVKAAIIEAGDLVPDLKAKKGE